jgi:DNA-binding NarL/FixJ family response regulator
MPLTEPARHIRVLVADDQKVVRDGIASLLGLLPGIEVVGTASGGTEAIRLALATGPDVVLMDLSMPGCDGAEATQRIVRERPGIRVVVLTAYSDDESVARALRVGALGFLTKDAGADEIFRAIGAVAAGDAQLDGSVQRRLVAAFTRGERAGFPGASPPAGPGTRSSRARIVQYAVMDISMREWSFEVIPICMARPVAETGASITGGAAQVGSVGDTMARRSWTSWRSLSRSVPGLNKSSIEESCGTDFDRRSSIPGMPARAASSGTVTSSSTSEVDRPTQMVCITTRGGANSGNTSMRICGSRMTPTAIRQAATAATR